MADTISTDRQDCINYLLGLMDESGMQAFEARYFADDALFELYEAVEEALIASHLAGKLPPEQEQRFRQHYLNSSQRRNKVQSAALLKQKLGPVAIESPGFWKAFWNLFKVQPPVFRYGAAFAAVALVLLTLISWTGVTDLNRQLKTATVQAKSERDRADAAQRQAAQDRTLWEAAQKALSGAATIAMALAPVSRGGEDNVLRPGSASYVELRLDLDGRPPSSRYRVTVKREEWVWSQEITENAVKDPVVRIPTSLLRPGRYEVEVQSAGTTAALSRLAVYHFSVPER